MRVLRSNFVQAVLGQFSMRSAPRFLLVASPEAKIIAVEKAKFRGTATSQNAIFRGNFAKSKLRCSFAVDM